MCERPTSISAKPSRHEHLDFGNRSTSASRAYQHSRHAEHLSSAHPTPPHEWLCRMRSKLPIDLSPTSAASASLLFSTVVHPLLSHHASATNSRIHANTEASAYTGHPPACLILDTQSSIIRIPRSYRHCLRPEQQIAPLSARSATGHVSGIGGNKRNAPAPPAHLWPFRPSHTPHGGVELGIVFIACGLAARQRQSVLSSSSRTEGNKNTS